MGVCPKRAILPRSSVLGQKNIDGCAHDFNEEARNGCKVREMYSVARVRRCSIDWKAVVFEELKCDFQNNVGNVRFSVLAVIA